MFVVGTMPGVEGASDVTFGLMLQMRILMLVDGGWLAALSSGEIDELGTIKSLK
jgi:hypothetical protein